MRSLSCVALSLLCAVGCSQSSPSTPAQTPAQAPTTAPSTVDATARVAPVVADASTVESAPAASTAAPAAQRPDGPMNVVFITVDSLRGDIFFPRGGAPFVDPSLDVAPTLRALMKRAVVYSHAYALSSYTSMSVGAFLAGKYPGEIKRSGFFFGSYPADVTMFPERLREAGVHTLGAQAHFYFRPDGSGLDQGFDVWKMVPDIKKNNLTDEDITGDKHAALARQILSDSANTSGRFFAWFHFMDPHDVYHKHEGINWGPKQRDRYLGEITFADAQLKTLLDFIDAQPWGKHTVIILSADHGESFGEHGHYRHGFELWQQLVHVPLFFVVPGARPATIDVARSHLDLAPTILDLLGVPAAADLKGKSLVSEFYQPASATARDIWVDLPRTSDNDRRRSLIHDSLKIIAYGDDRRLDVYDLAKDPDELTPLPNSDPRRADMVQRYRNGQAGFVDVRPTQARNLAGAPPGRGW